MDTLDLEDFLRDKNVIEIKDYREPRYEYTYFIKNLLNRADESYTSYFKRMGFDPTNYHKKLNKRYNRSFTRDELFKIFIYFSVDINEVQKFLKSNNYPILYVKNKRDLIIYISLLNNYDLNECNQMLVKHNLEII